MKSDVRASRARRRAPLSVSRGSRSGRRSSRTIVPDATVRHRANGRRGRRVRSFVASSSDGPRALDSAGWPPMWRVTRTISTPAAIQARPREMQSGRRADGLSRRKRLILGPGLRPLASGRRLDGPRRGVIRSPKCAPHVPSRTSGSDSRLPPATTAAFSCRNRPSPARTAPGGTRHPTAISFPLRRESTSRRGVAPFLAGNTWCR
jgi:hypothetical protein